MPLYGFGSNSGSQLGLGFESDKEKSVEIHIEDLNYPIKNIYGGGNHCVIQDIQNNYFISGCNKFGQLNYKEMGNIKNYFRFEKNKYWNEEGEKKECRIESISLGFNHTIIVKKNGEEDSNESTVFLFGDNTYHQLGHKDKKIHYHQINFSQKIKSVYSGIKHSIILTEEGKIYGMGDNKYGQLLKNPKENRFLIEITEITEVKDIIDISLGLDHTVLLTKENEIFIVGRNNKEQLANKEMKSSYKPIKLDLNIKVKEIHSGWFHNIIMDDENNIYSFGSNQLGELAIGKKDNNNNNNNILNKIELNNINKVSLGSNYNLYLLNNNELYTNGWNEHFNCIDENISIIYEPILIYNNVIKFGNGYAFTIIYIK
ncbi:RCC1/BLIP-II [Neoconidiobolus thromboides FSU 785]|nr:RCC1/BLIP-II [Neoconidiobolus thromboides FSU 785]